MAKNKISREEAEAHDAEVREWLKSQEAAWKDKYTVMLALGLVLPEKPLGPAAKKQLGKRADEIVRSVLIKKLDEEDVDHE